MRKRTKEFERRCISQTKLEKWKMDERKEKT